MGDLISRQAAIDAVVNCTNCGDEKTLRAYVEKHNLDNGWTGGVLEAIDAIEDLPSTQPEKIRINLNEPIKVKLTEWGKEIFYHQYDRVNEIIGREVCKPRLPKEEENGYTEFQLWEFIELYGTHMGMTLPNVIEPLEIVYGVGRVERREE